MLLNLLIFWKIPLLIAGLGLAISTILLAKKPIQTQEWPPEVDPWP